MRWFLIESSYADHVYGQHMVHAKTYEEACTKIAKIEGEGEYKLLGLYEPMEIDKKILKRIK